MTRTTPPAFATGVSTVPLDDIEKVGIENEAVPSRAPTSIPAKRIGLTRRRCEGFLIFCGSVGETAAANANETANALAEVVADHVTVADPDEPGAVTTMSDTSTTWPEPLVVD